MAEAYPWGSQAPTKRVAQLERQISANDEKRREQIEAHRKRIAEIDDSDRQLKKDLNAAQAVVDREHKEAMSAAATRTLEKVLAAAGTDIADALKSGELEKLLADALAKVGTTVPTKKRGSATAAAPAAQTPDASGDGGAKTDGSGDGAE